jgi:hypothetical protein
MMKSYQFNSMMYQFKIISIKNIVYRDETASSLEQHNCEKTSCIMGLNLKGEPSDPSVRVDTCILYIYMHIQMYSIRGLSKKYPTLFFPGKTSDGRLATFMRMRDLLQPRPVRLPLLGS